MLCLVFKSRSLPNQPDGYSSTFREKDLEGKDITSYSLVCVGSPTLCSVVYSAILYGWCYAKWSHAWLLCSQLLLCWQVCLWQNPCRPYRQHSISYRNVKVCFFDITCMVVLCMVHLTGFRLQPCGPFRLYFWERERWEYFRHNCLLFFLWFLFQFLVFMPLYIIHDRFSRLMKDHVGRYTT